MIRVNGDPLAVSTGFAASAPKKAEKTDVSGLIKRISELEAENRELKARVAELGAKSDTTHPSDITQVIERDTTLRARHAARQKAYRERKAARP